jgi:octaprenyl-diphosphate synthase
LPQPVPQQFASDRRASGIEGLLALVGPELQRVNQTILERMQSPVTLIPQLAGHIVASGGKRLRPLLVLACARLAGYRGDRQIRLATAVEFIHTATLLHDDVVDKSDLRRGQATANAVWGNQASVLVGDFLFARAFQLMVEDGSLAVLKCLSDAAATIAEGEVGQLLTANDPETTEAAYLEVIRGKTAALFAAACEVGAHVAARPAGDAAALRAFGDNLGIAFQMTDDVLDYTAKQATLGKTVGDDFREGKVTLPAILAFQRGNAKEREFWRRTLGRMEQTPEDLGQAIAFMEAHGALSESIARAGTYAERATETLARFEPSPSRSALESTARFAIERVY